MQFSVVAYADDEGNKRQETIVVADNKADAWKMAWRLFPMHHEIGVFEIEGE